jgi:hypothetical protein
MAFMYIPPPYRDEKYNQFIIIHDGRFFGCQKYWSVKRAHNGHFTLSIRERCRRFAIEIKLGIYDIRVDDRLKYYGLHVYQEHAYRYMLVYLRFYCDKLKHRPYHEVKNVIAKHFLRLGVYLSPTVSQLIILFHSCSTTFADTDREDRNVYINRRYRHMLVTS